MTVFGNVNRDSSLPGHQWTWSGDLAIQAIAWWDSVRLAVEEAWNRVAGHFEGGLSADPGYLSTGCPRSDLLTPAEGEEHGQA